LGAYLIADRRTPYAVFAAAPASPFAQPPTRCLFEAAAPRHFHHNGTVLCRRNTIARPIPIDELLLVPGIISSPASGRGYDLRGHSVLYSTATATPLLARSSCDPVHNQARRPSSSRNDASPFAGATESLACTVRLPDWGFGTSGHSGTLDNVASPFTFPVT
jgi:hypothetical protein